MMRKVGAFSHRIVATPGYLAERGAPLTPEDLIGHACLRYKYPSTGKLEPWPFMGDGGDLELPVTMAANALEPLICLAEADFGLTRPPQQHRVAPTINAMN